MNKKGKVLFDLGMTIMMVAFFFTVIVADDQKKQKEIPFEPVQPIEECVPGPVLGEFGFIYDKVCPD